jgi:tetratricopeptide (TPR) repeat protein
MVGIIQEQHPDRARLFMQWKQMEWPLLVDSYNLLGAPYVPITLAIDEYGVVRAIHPPLQKIGEFEAGFLERRFDPPAGYLSAGPAAPNPARLAAPASGASAPAWREYADALSVWGGPARLPDAIAAYGRAVAKDPRDPMIQFRLGVALRQRYDSDARQPDDFRLAVEHWGAALALDPNQYIFRRRIQQYGPRLDKPYPFYDWVPKAREEITARGEAPIALAIEPGGAEFAAPVKTFDAGPADAAAPDAAPDAARRIHEDDGRFVTIETVTVPATIAAGASARAHVVFRPNLAIKAHWNNEVDGLVFWVDPPRGWAVDQRRQTVPNPPILVSQELRKVEFEIRAPEGTRPGAHFIPGYALYYVCEDVNGVCLYRRQNVSVEVRVDR